MKKFEQVILKFSLKSIVEWEKHLIETQDEISKKGKEGFRLINSFNYLNGSKNFLICIMEKEIE